MESEPLPWHVDCCLVSKEVAGVDVTKGEAAARPARRAAGSKRRDSMFMAWVW